MPNRIEPGQTNAGVVAIVDPPGEAAADQVVPRRRMQRPLTRHAFCDAMAEMATGMTVLTARDADGAPRGLLVTSLCSYSVDPPSILACIERSRGSHAPLTRCRHFGVHLLASDQATVADAFALNGAPKFERVEWRWERGVPVLAGVLVFPRCRRVAVFAHGDHSIVIGEVLHGSRTAREPLLYLRRRMDWTLRSARAGPVPGAG